MQLALLPINGRDSEREALDLVGNLSPEEAASLIAHARIRAAMPMHYDMFAGNLGDPGAFVSAVARGAPDAAVLVPAHQRPLVFTGTAI